jgi:hypothetical protein
MLRNIKRNHALVTIAIILTLIMLTPSYGSVTATWNGVHDVNAPTAKNTTAHNYAYGADRAKKLDGLAIYLNPAGYVRTSDFTDPNYAEFLPFYGNRSDFPPGSAQILHVHLCWYAQGTALTQYIVYLQQVINGTYQTVFTSSTQWGTGSWNYFELHVNETVAWTASMLTNSTMFRVSLLSFTGHILVDYLGFRYLWTEGPPEYPDDGDIGGTFAMPDVSGLFGMVGFIGMVGVPAASIWFFRRDGGSKIMIGVSALVAFTVCFGLFLGSINGG